jgi:hypothetical protein
VLPVSWKEPKAFFLDEERALRIKEDNDRSGYKKGSVINERVSSIFFLAVSLAFLGAVLTMPFGQPREPGPGFMPLLLSLLMVSISGGLTVTAFLRPARPAGEPLEKGTVRRITLLVVGLALYCILLPVVGFLILTVIFEAIFLKVLGVPRWRTIWTVALAATAGASLVFEIWLQIPFPKGIWWPQ